MLKDNAKLNRCKKLLETPPKVDRNREPPKCRWASFVLPAKAVHENQYGKGLWAKIPADGHTTLTKPYLAGQSEDGKIIWKDEKTTVKVGENICK